MNRENVLFSLVGLLLGYVIAFHLVVHLNQNQPPLRASAAGGPAGAGETLPTNDVKDRQKLRSEAESAAQEASGRSDDFDAQVRAAVAAARAEDFERAVEFLTRANGLRPDDYETVVNLGNFNFESRRYDDAERWYRAALEKRPDDVDVRSDLALSYFLRQPRQTDRAIAEFNRVLEKNPQHGPTLHNLTLVLKETGKISEAEAVLARLEKADPNNTNLQLLREELRKARGQSQGSPARSGD